MNTFKKIFSILILLLFIGLPLYSYFFIGVFSWHISVPAYWKDALELSGYLLLIFIIGYCFPEIRGEGVILISALYFLSMGTLIQVIVGYLFIEATCLIGNAICKYSFHDTYSCSLNFCIGSIFTGGIFVVCSLLKIGSIDHLRIVFLSLVVISLIIIRNDYSMQNLLVVKFSSFANQLQRQEFIALLPLLATLLVAFARINTHIESDSSWYALYTDKNLFGLNSFYDFLGYTGFVYYYPKFKELFMAPVSGLKLAGYLISPNIWIMILMIDESYRYLCKKCTDITNSMKIVIVSVIYTTMAIIGTAGTAKSDTLGYFYLLLCWCTFNYFLEEYDYKYLLITICSGIMPFAIKYTHYIWCVCILFTFSLYFIILIFKKKVPRPKWNLSGLIFIGYTLGTVIGIIGRTMYLTGWPFGRIGVGFLGKLGFHGKSLFEFNDSTNMPTVFEPLRVWKTLFMAGQADKITAQWYGNYVIYLLFLVLVFVPYKFILRTLKEYWYKTLAITALNVLTLYFLVTMFSPDGNYFEATIFITTIETSILIYKYEKIHQHLTKLAIISGLIFCCLNFILNFTVDPSWGTGTRFSYDKIHSVKTQADNNQYINSLLKSYGIYEINEYLKSIDSESFVILDGCNAFLMCLDARVEMSADLSSSYISAVQFSSASDFEKYVKESGVNGFILFNDNSGDGLFEMYARNYLNEYGWVSYIPDEQYSYYKIN